MQSGFFPIFVFFNSLLVCSIGCWALEFTAIAKGDLRILRLQDDIPHNAHVKYASDRQSCGVRFHVHETYMVGSSLDAKEQRILALTYAANQTFSRGPSFDIHVHEIIYNSQLSLPSSNAQDILNAARQGTNFNHEACANVWMFGVHADDNVVGVAYMRGSCDDKCHGTQHVALVTLPHGSNVYQSLVDEAWVLSHELGHLLGATHIDGNSVMNPSVVHYISSANGFGWEAQSIAEIENHILGDCPSDTCLTTSGDPISPHIGCVGSSCHHHIDGGAGLAYLGFLGLLLLIPFLWYLPY